MEINEKSQTRTFEVLAQMEKLVLVKEYIKTDTSTCQCGMVKEDSCRSLWKVVASVTGSGLGITVD